MKILSVVSLVTVLCSVPVFAALDAEKVLAKMKERIAQVGDYSADIKQSFFWKVLNKHQEMRGTIRMKKPDKFFIDFKELQMVSNGAFVWRYTPETRQVIKSPMAASPEIPSLHDLFFDFDKGYRLDRLEETSGKMCILWLAPQTEMPNVRALRVWLDTKDWLIKEVRYQDDSENETIYQLSDIKINQGLSDKVFEYQAPKGAEVFETQ